MAEKTMAKYDPDEFFNRKKPTVVKFKCAVCGHLTPIPTRDMPPLLWRDDLITSSEFLTHSGPNGYEIHFRTPYRDKYLEVQRTCRKAIDHGKPTTNADRIRAMSDKELAEFISKTQGDIFRGEMRLTFQWLDWLRQEVET